MRLLVDENGVLLWPVKAPQLMLPAVQFRCSTSEASFIAEIYGKYSTGEAVGHGMLDDVIVPVYPVGHLMNPRTCNMDLY
jgi:hypothetical protein